jgi:hypothetical protein
MLHVLFSAGAGGWLVFEPDSMQILNHERTTGGG